MASPSVTYTFSNSTTADATQVNQNFTDIINGVTDGTKDLSISALTCAGTATLNGNINLGNSSGDDLTITASLASTLSIKTTTSYDIGSTSIGLRALYLGDGGSAARCTKILGATIASGWTLTLPTGAGINKFGLTTNGSGVTSWTPITSPMDILNYSISCSVAASALTVALKGYDGNDPSSTNLVDIAFRNATATSGTVVVRSASAATSVVVSSGSTLGHQSNKSEYIYVYALDNSGTVELAVSSTRYDDGSIVSTTAEGAAGAADSKYTIYSTSARSNVPLRLICRLLSTQTTAGTWAAAPTEVSLSSTPSIQRMGPLLAAIGSRVTTTPAAAGEYRCLIRNGTSTNNVTDNAPSAGPSDANGMLIYAVPWDTSGTSGQPNRWEVFVGRNKQVQLEFYNTTGRTGLIDTQYYVQSTSVERGLKKSYDPTTGVVQIDALVPSLSTNTDRKTGVGISGSTVTEYASCYFDIIVSDSGV